jgi:hypothetical protein
MKKQLRILVIVEAALCFALPTYFLFWGALTLPLWLMGASSGAGYAAVHALCTIGGSLGLWALFRTLRYYVSSRPLRAPNWPVVGLFTATGVASIWTEMTGQFAGFELDWFSAVSMIAPTLCAMHVLVLAIQKSKRVPLEAAENA